ncbi:Beta-chimaerin [Acropora cervicornis]|uniref:Beta-chimaerin n=1 Tax=Acropora cervicornis TaxID=6130 RepID=A0AAD9UYT4_ACRCE|nr:Beta-chimaerin [Acropora cervicornis]
MDSGWAQFRVLYNFEPRDRRDIAIEVGDVMIVAKPVSDFCDWLTGHNTRTREVGEFPGTYVEYIGDITHFPSVENNPQPPVPPPRPPRTPSRLPECDLSWHPKCTTDLSDIPCIIRTRRDEDDNDDNDDYIDLVTDPEEWKVIDVLVWLAATNHYLYAEVFRENEITGQKLRELTDVSLNQMNITDSTHKQSLLLAIQELFTGKSESTVGGHFFKEQNYVTLQWCDKCGKCLWGLHRQGVECSECRFQCHRMCMFDSVVVCPRVNRRRRRGSDAEVPIFGVELGDQFRPSDIPAPMVMMKCIQAVEKRGLNLLNIHGIIPPGKWRNPHCASAVLKMYLNELPTCVFTEERYGSFVGPFKDASTESIDEMGQQECGLE